MWQPPEVEDAESSWVPPEVLESQKQDSLLQSQSPRFNTASHSTPEFRGASAPASASLPAEIPPGIDFSTWHTGLGLLKGENPVPAQMSEPDQRLFNRNNASRADLTDQMAELRAEPVPTYQTSPTNFPPRMMDDIVGNDMAILNQAWKNIRNVNAKNTGDALQALNAVMAAIPPGTGEVPSNPQRDAEWAKREAMSPYQKRQLSERDPVHEYAAGLKQSADEVFPIVDPDSFSSKFGQAIGGFFPAVLTGKFAPVVFGLQAAGHSLEAAFKDAIDQGKSEDEAAKIATRKSLIEGAFQGLLMKFFPHQAKKLGDKAINKLLGDAMEKTLLKGATRFGAGRVAQGVEGAGFGAASSIGSNLIQGRNIEEGVGEAMKGMAAIQMFMRRGPTQNEITRRGAEKNAQNVEMARILDDHMSGQEHILSPDRLDMLNNLKDESGNTIKFTDLGPGAMARKGKDGLIEIDEVNLAVRLAGLPTESGKVDLLRSVFGEEVSHGPTTRDQAIEYFHLGSSAEQQLTIERYYGGKLPEGFDLKDPRFQAQVGWEMSRLRVQQILKMTPTETAMEHGFEKSKVRGLINLENMLWKMRLASAKLRNSSDAPVIKQQKMIDDVLLKINQAKDIIAKIPEAKMVDEPAKPATEPEVTSEASAEGINKDWKPDTSDYPSLTPNENEPFSKYSNKGGRAGEQDRLEEMERKGTLDEAGKAQLASIKSQDQGKVQHDSWKKSMMEELNSNRKEPDRPMSRKRSDEDVPKDEEFVDPDKSYPLVNIIPSDPIGTVKNPYDFNSWQGVHEYIKDIAKTKYGKATEENILKVEQENLDNPHQEVGDMINQAILERRKHLDQSSDSFPAAYSRGMSKKQFLEEKARQLKAAFLEGKGEEVPAHLASAGMPKNKGGESFEVPPEERVATGFKRLELRDIQDAAWDELGMDIKIKNKDYSESQVRDFNVDYDRPNFQRFAKKMRDVTTDVSFDQLVGIWIDKVWSMLIKATPERLSKLRKALGLEGKYGRRELGEDPLGRGDIAEYSEPTDISMEQFANRRREVLNKRIDKLEERAKQKLADAEKWSQSVSESEKEAAKDELFGPPGKGNQLRQEAADLTRQAQMLRYSLSKASPETLAKAYQEKDLRPMAQLPIGTITEQAKATAAVRVDVLRKEMKTATPERLIAIGKEMEGLAKMISRSEQISNVLGRPAERAGEGATATAAYRQKVVRAIAHKLIGEAFKYSEERAAVDRKEISIEEIDFNNQNKDSIPYYEITPGDLEIMQGDTTIPFRLKKILMHQARGKNTDLESASRKVVVVVGPENEVHMLSTYNDAGIQRVTDPNFRGEHRPYRELNTEFLKKYHPIASLLLKDPVKGLNQQFSKVSEYMDRIGTEAKKNSEFRGDYQQGLEAELHDIGGTSGLEGELGSFQGPERELIDFGPRNPTLLKNRPLSRGEAFAVAKYSKSTSAVRDRIAELKKRAVEAAKPTPKGAKSKKLTSREILEINAFRKISERIEESRKQDPEITSDPARSEADTIGRVAERIMDAGMWGTPVKNLLRSFGQKNIGTFEKERTKPELTMRGDIRPPTSQRAFMGPFQRAEAPGAEIGLRNPKPYIPESVKSEPYRQTEAESYASRKMETEQNWAAAFRNKSAEQESGAARAKRIRERIFRKRGVLPSKAEAAKLAGYEGPMSVSRGGKPEPTKLEELKEERDKAQEAYRAALASGDKKKTEQERQKYVQANDAFRAEKFKKSNAPAVTDLAPRENDKYYEMKESLLSKKEARRIDRERQGDEQSFPESWSRSIGKGATHAVQDWLTGYDEWMVDRLTRHGGDMANAAGVTFRGAIDREKQFYGRITPILDKARVLAGGTEKKKWVGQVPTAKALRAVHWANKIKPIEGAEESGISNVSNIFDKVDLQIPSYAVELVREAKLANIEIGKLLEKVIPGFKATGKFQRNITSFGYDILKQGNGELWNRWAEGTAKANNLDIAMVHEHFREFKKVIDTPGANLATLEKVNQDFTRAIPIAVTHLRDPITKMWEPVLHSDMFAYLENTARRATHLTAFREVFPATDKGYAKLEELRESVANETGSTGQTAFDNLVRTMQGLPTDNYNPNFPGQAFRTANSTIGNLMAKMALTGQMFVQVGETMTGATPVFLGYRNYLRAIARADKMYEEMELRGEVNRVMYDFSMNQNSPFRSGFRIAGNTISKLFAEQWFNEMQETLAATTATIVSERITANKLTASEKRLLPQTFKAMGFATDEVMGLMQGDPALLGQFQRKASAFLTSGNKSIAEGSALGANRLVNSIFRFQSYPMMKMNQLRKVTGSMAEAWTSGTAYEKKRSTELFARFAFGSAAQGMMTTAITAGFYGGVVGLKTALNEAKDAPIKFMTESLLSAISGPLYLAWRGMKYKGLKGFTDSVGRIIFPYSIFTELTDMAQGAGRYNNQDWFQRFGSFINARIPGTRPIQQALAMTGLSKTDKKLEAALTAMYRWKRDEFGFDERFSYLKESELEKDFRVKMGKAIEALKEGNQEKFLDAYIAASENRMERGTGDEISFSSRKVLKNAKNTPLTLEQKESLRKRIGNDAYERLEYYDLMLEAAGEGLVLPGLD